MNRPGAIESSSKRASRAPVRRVRGAGIAPARIAFDARRSANGANRRRATESRDAPLTATVPHPQPSLGLTRGSRPVSGQETRLRGGKDGCRGWILACRESREGLPGGGARAGLGETPRGFSPEGPARTGALPRSDTGATPARQRRAPARNESRAARRVSGGEGFQVAFPSQAGAWRSPRQRLPSRPPMRNNPSEKAPADLRSTSQPFDGCIPPRKQLIAKTTHPTSEITSGISP